MPRFALPLGTLAVIAGCVAAEPPAAPARDPMAAAAENACLGQANTFAGTNGSTVVSSEFSEANSLVIIEDPSGGRYRCLSSNGGQIAEFSLL